MESFAEIQEGAEPAPSLARKDEITRRLADFLAQFSTLVMDWDADTALVWAKSTHSHEVKRQGIKLFGGTCERFCQRHQEAQPVVLDLEKGARFLDGGDVNA